MKQKTYIGIVVSFVMAIIFGMEVYASSHETNINFPKQSLSDPCMLYDSLIFNRGQEVRSEHYTGKICISTVVIKPKMTFITSYSSREVIIHGIFILMQIRYC